MSRARLIDSVQTLAARPYSVLLASATASSGVRKLIATSTGPKISTRAQVEAGETLVSSVGGKKQPSAGSVARRLEERRALLDALRHQLADALELHRRDDRADIDGLVERRRRGACRAAS